MTKTTIVRIASVVVIASVALAPGQAASEPWAARFEFHPAPAQPRQHNVVPKLFLRGSVFRGGFVAPPSIVYVPVYTESVTYVVPVPVAAPAPVAPPPPPDDMTPRAELKPKVVEQPKRHTQLYRWTDEQGGVHWTDRWDAIPAAYRGAVTKSQS
jgi:hypothetical protein